MTTAEFTTPRCSTAVHESVSTRQGLLTLVDESIEVYVDEEWCVVGGAHELAALLELDFKSIRGGAIGRLIHPDDVVVSPARIWRSGKPTVIKFGRGDDYVRLALRIRRAANGWLLELTGLEAEILPFHHTGMHAN